MPIQYTICHNDDDRRDPNHRRVLIEARDIGEFGDTQHDRRLIICADGVPTDAPLCADEAEVEKIIKWYWDDPIWDLRRESAA